MIETTETPIRSRIDYRTTDRSIKKILADGTPRWVSHPQDFSQWARECYLEEKEESTKQVAAYREEEQDTLTDYKARKIHPMSSRDFIQKLRDNGVKCFTYQVPHGPGTPARMMNTVGLWCVVPDQSGIGFLYQGQHYQYMTWLQIPFMWEWSLLPLDEHQLSAGENRGWRTVLARLIARKVLTEQKAHLLFGEPSGATSKIYKRTLFDFRNGRYRPNDRSIATE